MRTMIFDIETVGEDWDALDETTQGMLTRWIDKTCVSEEDYSAKLDDIKNGLGFSPFTGQIVAIGVYDLEKEKGAVYYTPAGGETAVEDEDGQFSYKPKSEKEMLEQFWEAAKSYQAFVSFNGRAFDAPYLVSRSMVHGVRPSKNLLANRYLNLQPHDAKHIDLFDQLTFYGAVRRGASLHLVCRALGVKSPKGDGVDGDHVSELFRSGRSLDIARYNAGDLIATAEVYRRWAALL